MLDDRVVDGVLVGSGREPRLLTGPDLEARVEAALGALDLTEQVRILTGASFWHTHAAPEVGLRPMLLSDGPAGVRGERADEREPSASLPCPSALAATWDEPLLFRVGQLLAAQARAKGADVVLGPTVNLHRSPLGGRHFECLSEDPLLTARAAGALVQGIQDGGVAACVKHYVANESETDRFTVDARVDERTLHEVYLAPFEYLVTRAGAWSVMAAYNSVDGATMTESPLLRDPLRTSWGFDGVVVSDWIATRSTVRSALAGLDLVMPGPFGPWGPALVTAVRAGRVPAEVVEDKARRLLRLAARVGALGGGEAETRAVAGDDGGHPAGPVARALLRETAAAGMVLLRNDAGLLPLTLRAPAGEPARLPRVALIGPGAARPRGQGGGSATVLPPHLVSPADGLRAALGDTADVVVVTGARAEPWPAPVGAANARDPLTGEPGVLVRLLADDGRELRVDRRLSGQLLFLGDTELALAERVEASTLVRATVAGRYPVGFGAVGLIRLTARVGGAGAPEKVLFDGTHLPEDGDVVAGFLRPPVWWDEIDLSAGDEVLLTLTYLVPSGMPVAAFGLYFEEPIRPECEEFAAAVAAARDADVAVVVVGTTERTESEGTDRETLALPEAQDDLVRRVAAVNPRTVVVVNAGAPVLMPWRDEVAAVLLAWFPGQEFGAALADVLLGVVEPGGRLPTTWPAREEDCPVFSVTPADGVLDYTEGPHLGYRGWARRPQAAPAYPFGHGLGYTTWSYEAIDAPARVGPGEPLRARVTVRNTGGRAGRAVVQAYLSRPASVLERPALWLAGFSGAIAQPGEAVAVEVSVAPRAFEHWQVATAGGKGRWAVEPGTFVLSAGPSSATLPLRHEVVVEASFG